MTEHPASLDSKIPDPVSPPNCHICERHSIAESIAAALEWLSTAYVNDHWTDLAMPSGAADVWVTACVLARLGDLPLACIGHRLQQDIEKALDWLERVRVPGSGWCGPHSGDPDAFTTSWAILALRSHHRSVPAPSLEMVLRCRQANGGFSAYARNTRFDGPYNVIRPEITITAMRALRIRDSAAEAFVISCLGNDSAAQGSMASCLYVCSEALDRSESLVPSWPLLKQISQWIAACSVEQPYELALLLRALLRLRDQRAWEVAVALCAMQLAEGSWHASAALGPSSQILRTVSPAGFAHSKTIATTTALSALAMSKSQPGLYFGSDLPRRLRDC